jgi:hypothetical protein
VIGTGVTVDAAVLAAAIGVYACVESDVGAVVVSDGRACVVPKELGARVRVVGISPTVADDGQLLEAIGRVVSRSPAAYWILVHGR